MCWNAEFERRLAQRRAEHLLRRRVTLESPQAPRVRIDGCTYLNFCSNDYLGLANDPRVVRAFQRAAEEYGVGAGASHLVTGHHAAHQALEDALADFVGAPRTLLFSTGYMANLGVAAALMRRGDLVLEDRLNHASMIDAGQLCRAEFRRYAHGDVADARRLLAGSTSARKLMLTDAVFSMDGDLAPVPELLSLGAEFGAKVVLDDAHGLGVIGEQGRGSVEYHALSWKDPLVLMGTLGKALGTFGAFVAGDENLIEVLLQDARTYIYTTAPPPAIAAATREALRIVRQEPWRRDRLHGLVQRFRNGAGDLGLPLGASETPIQPLIVGTSQRALALSEGLKRAGILVTAIRPPTVPARTARLRVTFSAGHGEDDVDRLLDALSGAFEIREP